MSSRPVLIHPPTASGITTKRSTDPERVIPVTTRPDGTVRKERKVRPGFTPAEDVTRFKTKPAAAWSAGGGGGGFGGIVGMAPIATDTSSTLSKAQKKNEKRKERRQASAWHEDGEDSEADSGKEEKPAVVNDPWDDTPVITKKELKPPRSLFQSSIAAITTSSTVQPAKRQVKTDAGVGEIMDRVGNLQVKSP